MDFQGLRNFSASAAPACQGSGDPPMHFTEEETRGASEQRPKSCLVNAPQLSIFSAAMNASCGISTFPNWRIFFLPSFCFSSSLRLRVTSPP